MRATIFAFLIFISISSNAQNHFLGVKVGTNFTNVTMKDDWENPFRIGLIGGMTYQMMVGENLFLGADMLYEQRGYKSKTFYELIAEDGVATITYQYLSTPLKVGYQTRGNVSYYSSIGIVPAFLLRANHHFPWDREPRDLEVTDLASDFDIGGLIEIGANIKINEVIIGFLQLAYQHSFTTVSNSDYFADSSVRNFGISLTIGVKFGLD